MPRLSRTLLLLALALAGCHSSGTVTPLDGGEVDAGSVEPEPDSGPILKSPNIADTLGPNTGAYDVNGGGRLLVIEVDGRVGLEVSDQQDLFLGAIDGGQFQSETLFPDQESCGPVTLDGEFHDGGSYSATKTFCANGTQVDGPLQGARLLAPNVYKQNLAWSGAYDAVESPSASNGCITFTGSHPLTIAVARDLDGGGTTALLVGDGLREQLVFGRVDDSTGILNASAVNEAGQATDSFTLFFTEDGGVGGARIMDLGTPGNPCPAHAELYGSKR